MNDNARLSTDSIKREPAVYDGSRGLTDENRLVCSRSTLPPTGIPQEPRSSQNAPERHQKPFDENKLWKPHEALLSSLPEAEQNAVKIGIISEYVLQGIRARRNTETLLLLAALGISIANNDRPFFENVRQALGK